MKIQALMTILNTILVLVNCYMIGQCMSYLNTALINTIGFFVWVIGVYLRIYGTLDRITSG